MEFIGIDLHLKLSNACILNEAGDKTGELSFPTTQTAFQRHFEAVEPARIIIEAGSYSPWVRRFLSEYCHEVINPEKWPLRNP